MAGTTLTSLAIASILVSLIVAATSFWVLRRQERAMFRVQQLAGVKSVETLEVSTPNPLIHLLRQTAPRYRLRILTITGAALVRAGEVELRHYADRGVAIDILLMDPQVPNWMFNDDPTLVSRALVAADMLKGLAESSAIRLRYYNQPVLESLVFVDEAELWLSPALPFVTQRPLLYRIVNGPNSLYRLYEAGFEFLWSRSRPAEQSA